MASFLDFFRISSPSAAKVAPENTDKVWKRSRFQSFIAITFGYALYYVCRMSMGVMKQPLIDAGLLNAAVYSQLCYELARDIEEQDFPWDDDGVKQLQSWLQSRYEAYCAAHSA